jgi:hypothetical protein
MREGGRSSGSSPATADSTIALSMTVRVMGTTWSSEEAKATTPEAGNAAVGRLHPDDAAEGGGLAVWTRGVRPHGEGGEAGPDRRSGPAGGAGDPFLIHRFLVFSKKLSRWKNPCELTMFQLSQSTHRRLPAFNHRRRVGRNKVLQHS